MIVVSQVSFLSLLRSNHALDVWASWDRCDWLASSAQSRAMDRGCNVHGNWSLCLMVLFYALELEVWLLWASICKSEMDRLVWAVEMRSPHLPHQSTPAWCRLRPCHAWGALHSARSPNEHDTSRAKNLDAQQCRKVWCLLCESIGKIFSTLFGMMLDLWFPSGNQNNTKCLKDVLPWNSKLVGCCWRFVRNNFCLTWKIIIQWQRNSIDWCMWTLLSCRNEQNLLSSPVFLYSFVWWNNQN